MYPDETTGWTAADYDDWDAGQFSYDLGSNAPNNPVSYTPAQTSSPSLWDKITGAADKVTQGVAWDRVLGKGLDYALQRDQLQAQTQLLMAGRSLGYRPLLGNPALYGGTGSNLPQLLLIGGLVWLGLKAVKS